MAVKCRDSASVVTKHKAESKDAFAPAMLKLVHSDCFCFFSEAWTKFISCNEEEGGRRKLKWIKKMSNKDLGNRTIKILVQK